MGGYPVISEIKSIRQSLDSLMNAIKPGDWVEITIRFEHADHN